MQRRKLTVKISFPDSLLEAYDDERIRNFMTANIEYAVETKMPELKESFACGEVAFGSIED